MPCLRRLASHPLLAPHLLESVFIQQCGANLIRTSRCVKLKSALFTKAAQTSSPASFAIAGPTGRSFKFESAVILRDSRHWPLTQLCLHSRIQ
mmetsp:Transcript_45646/g.98869  ORF Transcript_45646/g.98869 Transcript_45646/m.98869 type:complete len:93 (-) Transcript_45646:723-1001(-)